MQTLIYLLLDVGLPRPDQHDDLLGAVTVEQVIYDLESP